MAGSRGIIKDKILDGKRVANAALESVKKEISLLKSKNITPSLRVALVGDDPASAVYTRTKAKKCKELGMDGELITLPANVSQDKLLSTVKACNDDGSVHGILVQLPLPSHIDTQAVLHSISPEKDVDGFHSVNVGRLQKMHPNTHIPCTARGIWEILRYYNIAISGANVAVVGRSEIVGKPISALLSAKHEYGNATVTLCHSATRDIPFYTTNADIVIAAIGKPNFITADMVQDGATIIDVGINRVGADTPKGYKLIGDVDFEAVRQKAHAITPVPGGVGPTTIAMLMRNTVHAAKMQNGIQEEM